MPSLRPGLALAVLLAAWAHPADAQTSAQINGQITDSSGAVLVGAQVRLANAETGAVRESPANEHGYFRFPSLTPGNYSLTVQMRGFKSATRAGLQLNVQQILRVDFSLQVGDISEAVTVTADAPLLQDETATVATTVDSRAVTDLPLASSVSGRDPVELLQVLPGATNRGIAGTQSVNGGLQGVNDIQVDGISKVEERYGNSSGAGGIPSVDTVREVKLMTNIYSAEFGRSGGATVIVATKSGTNQLHGSAYEFFRNTKLAARNFFSPFPPPLHSNQFGATLGGPIRRNKTFFFATFEAWYVRTDMTTRITVPTELQRGGDFSQTYNYLGRLTTVQDPLTTRRDPARPNASIRDQFPGNRIPSSRFDTVGAKIASYYGRPNITGIAVTGANNYFVGDSGGRQFNQTLQHITHQFGSHNTLSARFFLQQLDQKQPVVFDNIFNPGNNNQHAPNRFVALQDTHVLRPSLVNEARLGVNRHVNEIPPKYWGDANAEIGLKGLPSPALTSPRINVSGYAPLGNPQYTGAYQTILQGADSISYSRGKHQVKFGGDARRFLINSRARSNEFGSLTFGGAFTNQPGVTLTGNALADLLLGYPSTGFVGINPGYGYRSSYYAVFIQEDWKARSNLVLNIGLRYDYESPAAEASDRMGTFDPSAIEPITKLPGALRFLQRGGTRTLVRPDRNNWGPRIGFAWSPRFASALVVRGGYGIQYSPLTRQTQWLHPGYTATTTFTSLNDITPAFPLSQGFPFYSLPSANPSISALLGQGASWIDSSNRTPYSQLWSFGLQKQFPALLLLDVSYVGNKGTRLPHGNQININQLPASLLAPGILNPVPNPWAGLISGSLGGATWTRAQSMRPFPQYTSVGLIGQNSASSIYHSLQVKAEKRFSKGLYAINSFTYSRMLADSSGADRGLGAAGPAIQDHLNLRAERGRTTLDMQRRFTSMLTYDLPVGKGRRWPTRGGWTNLVLGGWQINWVFTAQTGMPLTITNTNFTYAGGGSRPNRVCDGKLEGGQRAISRYFNTACFADQPSYTFGNAGVGIVDGPGLWNLDLSLFKKLALSEKVSLQYRAEAFNSLNHTNFSNPATLLNSATFGVISSTQGANLSPMGGPRMIQMALKLVF